MNKPTITYPLELDILFILGENGSNIIKSLHYVIDPFDVSQSIEPGPHDDFETDVLLGGKRLGGLAGSRSIGQVAPTTAARQKLRQVGLSPPAVHWFSMAARHLMCQEAEPPLNLIALTEVFPRILHRNRLTDFKRVLDSTHWSWVKKGRLYRKQHVSL